MGSYGYQLVKAALEYENDGPDLPGTHTVAARVLGWAGTLNDVQEEAEEEENSPVRIRAHHDGALAPQYGVPRGLGTSDATTVSMARVSEGKLTRRDTSLAKESAGAAEPGMVSETSDLFELPHSSAAVRLLCIAAAARLLCGVAAVKHLCIAAVVKLLCIVAAAKLLYIAVVVKLLYIAVEVKLPYIAAGAKVRDSLLKDVVDSNVVATLHGNQVV
jgi:hypothetical protein